MCDTPVDDAAVKAVSGFPALKRLDLSRTRVSQKGIDALRKALPTVDIFWAPAAKAAAAKATGGKPARDRSANQPRDRGAEEEAIQRIKALKGRAVTDPVDGSIFKVVLNKTAAGDADLPFVARLPDLRELYLNFTQVGDEGMKELAGLTMLERLEIHHTKVGSAGFKQLGGLKALTVLVMADTPVDDAAVKAVSGFPALKRLDLSRTRVSEKGAKTLRKALPKVEIFWAPGT